MLLFNILCKETVALADISLIDLINSAMARLPCYPALWGLVGIAHCWHCSLFSKFEHEWKQSRHKPQPPPPQHEENNNNNNATSSSLTLSVSWSRTCVISHAWMDTRLYLLGRTSVELITTSEWGAYSPNDSPLTIYHHRPQCWFGPCYD